MALSLRQGRFCAPKFDRNLVCQMLQWKCKYESKKFARDKFSGGDLGYFLSRALTTINLEKAIVKPRVSTAQSVAVLESKDVKREMGSCGLNEEQASVVETNDKYVRVVAGPGSGKTRVLTHRIAYMVTCCNVSPSSVLCITFTNKAARELFERLNNLLDKNVSRKLTVGTIHSLCAKILRSEQVSDYHIDNDYIICDENDSEKVVKRILREVVGCLDANKASNGNKPLNADANLEGISGQNMDEIVMQSSESELWKDLARCKFFTRNASERLELLQFLERYDTGKSEKRKSVPAGAVKGLLHIISKARLYNMQTFLARKHQRSVPDLPYGLYGFGLKMAEIYELELRRSNAVDFDDLLYIAARLLHNNKHIRKEYRIKWRHILVDEFQDIDEIQYELINLLSVGNQSLFVVGDIDQAIYAWRGANAAHMQYTLERDFPNITTFKEVRYILAYLRFIGNCEDQMALESIINVPTRGIGEQTLAALKRWASDRNLTLSSALKFIRTDGINRKELKIRTNARTALLQFWELIEGFQNLIHTETIGTIIEAIIERTDFKTYLKNSDNMKDASKKQLDRLSILQTIGDSATQRHGIGKMALATFLQEISLASDQENIMSNKDGNCVKLMTLHAAKGLEFDSVFITGLQDGLLPLQDANIDEERRLFYVGITRAIKQLYITFSRSTFRQGKTVEAKPSKFIMEILKSPELTEVQ
ncbi:uncharacterized protein LOC131026808 isoform X3 [Cryptomeria japonica]|uniref:uncharacterized protein LOC131026808 isoform X3 n=1 Tax=Cryptomeria japonica TaxID=3369 RepID=UPI0025AD0704|nr:uncharacterized protein LOC131026808 isoform X3 [Cryptomeria japonica]